MKYKDVLYNITLLSEQYDREIDRIEIVKIDFDSLAKELKIRDFFIGTGKLPCFEHEGIIFCEEDEHAILKAGKATFFTKRCPENFSKELLGSSTIMLFTTKEVLSEEEMVIKRLIE